MSRVYMIRHGQTLFNVLRRKQGWCDSPLTEVGIGQAVRPALTCASAESRSTMCIPALRSAAATLRSLWFPVSHMSG